LKTPEEYRLGLETVLWIMERFWSGVFILADSMVSLSRIPFSPKESCKAKHRKQTNKIIFFCILKEATK